MNQTQYEKEYQALQPVFSPPVVTAAPLLLQKWQNGLSAPSVTAWLLLIPFHQWSQQSPTYLKVGCLPFPPVDIAASTFLQQCLLLLPSSPSIIFLSPIVRMSPPNITVVKAINVFSSNHHKVATADAYSSPQQGLPTFINAHLQYTPAVQTLLWADHYYAYID